MLELCRCQLIFSERELAQRPSNRIQVQEQVCINANRSIQLAISLFLSRRIFVGIIQQSPSQQSHLGEPQIMKSWIIDRRPAFHGKLKGDPQVWVTSHRIICDSGRALKGAHS